MQLLRTAIAKYLLPQAARYLQLNAHTAATAITDVEGTGALQIGIGVSPGFKPRFYEIFLDGLKEVAIQTAEEDFSIAAGLRLVRELWWAIGWDQ